MQNELKSKSTAVLDRKKKTMKAAVLHEFGKPLVIEDVLIPELKPHEILIKLEASGVCHTDLHAVQGDWPEKPILPLIPGHEGAGIIAEVGSEVKFLKVGDRVGTAWLYSACEHCDYCWSGRETLCKAQKNTGYSVNGTFAEYVVADPDYVGRLPDNVDFTEIAPVLCAGITVYKGLKVSEAKPGDWVVISGIGGLGHMAVQYATAMGLNVAAVDVDDSKLDLARKVGAKLTVNVRKTDPVEYLKKEMGGGHAVIVTAPSTKAFDQAVGLVRRGGTVVLIGLPPGTFPLSIIDMVMDGTTLRGSIVGTRLDLEEALSFSAAGKVKATVTTAKLENINEVLDQMRENRINGRVSLDYRK